MTNNRPSNSIDRHKKRLEENRKAREERDFQASPYRRGQKLRNGYAAMMVASLVMAIILSWVNPEATNHSLGYWLMIIMTAFGLYSFGKAIDWHSQLKDLSKKPVNTKADK